MSARRLLRRKGIAGIVAPTPALVVAGDIANSGSGDTTTAALVAALSGVPIQTLGDNVYPDGITAGNWSSYYDPTWGAHKARTRPAIGNHDVYSGGDESQTYSQSAYNTYWGALNGDGTTGYYDYALDANWQVIVLNSEVSPISTGAGLRVASTQEAWLRGRLAALIGKRVIVVAHRPRVSSGNSHGSNADMQALWKVCADFGVALFLSGHDHTYERFSPLGGFLVAPPSGGLRQFVVGTGGMDLNGFGTPLGASQFRSAAFGVLVLWLTSTGYSWEQRGSGGTVIDSGSATCGAVALPLVYDTFTASDGTAVGARTTDSGHTWQTDGSGAVAVQSNRAVASSFSAYRWINAGAADVELAMQANPGGSDSADREIGLYFRRQDASNFWQARLARTSSGTVTFQLVKRVAGSDQTPSDSATSPTFPLSTVTEIGVRCKGSTIEGYLNGVLVCATTDASFNTATNHGFRWALGAPSGSYIDNYTIKAA